MVAYKIDSVNDMDFKAIEEHLRVVFLNDKEDVIPAARCEDYFAKEILAENNGGSS